MSELEIRLPTAKLTCDLKGRVTKPAIGIQDSAFIYVPSINTDLQATFNRIFADMGERKKERV